MTKTTFQRRLEQLLIEIMQHPHKAELTALLQKQLDDDTFVLVKEHQ